MFWWCVLMCCCLVVAIFNAVFSFYLWLSHPDSFFLFLFFSSFLRLVLSNLQSPGIVVKSKLVYIADLLGLYGFLFVLFCVFRYVDLVRGKVSDRLLIKGTEQWHSNAAQHSVFGCILNIFMFFFCSQLSSNQSLVSSFVLLSTFSK